MKVIRGLSLTSDEGIHVALEADNGDVAIELEHDNFSADFTLPRRQCREMRDWLNVLLDD